MDRSDIKSITHSIKFQFLPKNYKKISDWKKEDFQISHDDFL